MAGADLHKRVLLLGPTGVDKREAVTRLSGRLKSVLGHNLKYIDFENEFLKPELNVKNWTVFLAQDIAQQATTWRRGWNALKGRLDNEITILGLHATYISLHLVEEFVLFLAQRLARVAIGLAFVRIAKLAHGSLMARSWRLVPSPYFDTQYGWSPPGWQRPGRQAVTH